MFGAITILRLLFVRQTLQMQTSAIDLM